VESGSGSNSSSGSGDEGGSGCSSSNTHMRGHMHMGATVANVEVHVQKTEPLRRNSDFQKKTCFACRKIGMWHFAVILFSQVSKKCKDLNLSLLYILILGTYSKFARKNNFQALGVCFSQPCSSAGRRFAASRSRSQKTNSFVSTKIDEMHCKLDSIENLRSFHKYRTPP